MKRNFKEKVPQKRRTDPLVSIGLLLDANYLPIDMCIYPGNENEKPHFTDVINEMKAKNKINNRTIYIADKGLSCGNNIFNALKNGDGYIYSVSVRGASKKLKSLLSMKKVLNTNLMIMVMLFMQLKILLLMMLK